MVLSPLQGSDNPVHDEDVANFGCSYATNVSNWTASVGFFATMDITVRFGEH